MRGRDCGDKGKGTRDEKQGTPAPLRAGSTPGALPDIAGSTRTGPRCPLRAEGAAPARAVLLKL